MMHGPMNIKYLVTSCLHKITDTKGTVFHQLKLIEYVASENMMSKSRYYI